MPPALAALSVFVLLSAASGEDEKADPKVTPEIVAKVTEFFKKVDAARRPRMDERMATEIQEIAKATGLGLEGVKTLHAAAGPAEDAAQAEQLANQIKTKPAVYAGYGPASMQFFDRPDFIQEMADAPETIPYTGPTEQPAWKAAVAQVLTPEQAAAWARSREEQATAARKEIQPFLDTQVTRYRPGQAMGITGHAHAIIAALNLPKDRADAINALADKAVDASMARWRGQVEESLLKQGATQRSVTIKAQNFYLAFEDADSPEKLPVWTEGLARLLTDTERARLVAVQDEQRKRGIEVLERLMVALLDEKIAFRREQRARLEPLASRLVGAQTAFFPDPGVNVSYYTYSPAAFGRLTGEAKADEVQPILDGIQYKRWQKLKDQKDAGQEESEDGTVPAASPTPAGAAEVPAEPEDLEQTVADFLHTRAITHHQEVESGMILRAEDAARVADLPAAPSCAPANRRTRAAEATTAAWLANIEDTVHSSVQGATADNIQAKLASISSYYSSSRRSRRAKGCGRQPWTPNSPHRSARRGRRSATLAGIPRARRRRRS